MSGNKFMMVERYHDMSPCGTIKVGIDGCDGDVHLSIYDDKNECLADLEFCSTGSGGGKSPNTVEAIKHLFIAIAKDNELNKSRMGEHHFQPTPEEIEIVNRMMLGSESDEVKRLMSSQ